jgi:hypothetical protein
MGMFSGHSSSLQNELPMLKPKDEIKRSSGVESDGHFYVAAANGHVRRFRSNGHSIVFQRLVQFAQQWSIVGIVAAQRWPLRLGFRNTRGSILSLSLPLTRNRTNTRLIPRRELRRRISKDESARSTGENCALLRCTKLSKVGSVANFLGLLSHWKWETWRRPLSCRTECLYENWNSGFDPNNMGLFLDAISASSLAIALSFEYRR